MISVTSARRGFTYVEVLLVIIIIGVFIGVAVPRFQRTIDTYRLRDFTHDIVSLARYLQGEAIGRSQIYCLAIAQAPVTFQGRMKTETEFSIIPGRFGSVYEVPRGISVTVEPHERRQVYFYPDGSSDTISIRFENRYGEHVSLLIQGTVGQIKIT